MQRDSESVFNHDYEKKLSQENLGRQETELTGESKKICNVQRMQIYSTINETKTEFAKSTKRSKKIVYCYMEGYGYRYNNKLEQFVTTSNSRKNCSIDLKLRDLKSSKIPTFCPFFTANFFDSTEKQNI